MADDDALDKGPSGRDCCGLCHDGFRAAGRGARPRWCRNFKGIGGSLIGFDHRKLSNPNLVSLTKFDIVYKSLSNSSKIY